MIYSETYEFFRASKCLLKTINISILHWRTDCLLVSSLEAVERHPTQTNHSVADMFRNKFFFVGGALSGERDKQLSDHISKSITAERSIFSQNEAATASLFLELLCPGTNGKPTKPSNKCHQRRPVSPWSDMHDWDEAVLKYTLLH